jgi:hypothetical protein
MLAMRAIIQHLFYDDYMTFYICITSDGKGHSIFITEITVSNRCSGLMLILTCQRVSLDPRVGSVQ